MLTAVYNIKRYTSWVYDSHPLLLGVLVKDNINDLVYTLSKCWADTAAAWFKDAFQVELNTTTQLELEQIDNQLNVRINL